MIKCSKCFNDYHKSCFPFTENFLCPKCQIKKFSFEKERQFIQFIVQPQFLYKPNTGEPKRNELTFKISMKDLIPIKNESTLLVLSSLIITENKVEFKWPKDCDIFINLRQFKLGRKDVQSKNEETSYFFYFRENHIYDNKAHFNYFCDWLYVDEPNHIEFKQTFPYDNKEMYIFCIWLCKDYEKDDIEVVIEESDTQCICNVEGIKEYIELSEDEDEFTENIIVEILQEENNNNSQNGKI